MFRFGCRLFLLFALLFWSNRECTAQGKFESGFLFGLNTSQITGDNLAGYDKPSLTAGIWVRRFISEQWALSFEMAWLPKGSRSVLRAQDSIPTLYRLNLRYIELPLMVQWKPKRFPKWMVESGLGTGVYISHTEEDEFGDLSGIYGPREQFKPFDISFNVGLTWLFHSRWALNVRSANSIFPVRNHDQQTHFRLNQGQYSSCIMGRLIYMW